MTDYRLKAEPGSYRVSGHSVELRHVAPLPNDHPLLIKLGSVSSNHADIEWYLREMITVLDKAPEKPLTKKIARANQIESIGKVLVEGFDLQGVDSTTRTEAAAFLEELFQLQEERNRLAHDPWRADKKTGELVQFRTRGTDKVVVVPEAKVDDVVNGFRRLRERVVELHAAVFRHANAT